MTDLLSQLLGSAIVVALLGVGVLFLRRWQARQPAGLGEQAERLAVEKARERERVEVARADETLRAATERIERTRTAEAERDPVDVANERIRRRP